MTREWFEKMGQEHYEEHYEDFRKVIEYYESWGLLSEVIEWTHKFYKDGNTFDIALSYAMTEWDL